MAIYRLEGKQFGRLTVVKRVDSGVYRKNALWECKCECGNTTFVTTCHLTSKHTQSCGCLKKQTVNDGQFKKVHGLSHKRPYRIWANMKARCFNPKNNKYHIYGGRGISVCEEWKNSFQAFYEWATTNGYKDDLTIDRIDGEGNYEPSNCRWTTYSEQNKNRKFRKLKGK